MLKKVLKENEENLAYLSNLPKIYLIATRAKTEVFEFPFAEELQYDKYMLRDVPLIYQFDNHIKNIKEYHLRKITYATPGFIVGWTMDKDEAEMIAEQENARCDD